MKAKDIEIGGEYLAREASKFAPWARRVRVIAKGAPRKVRMDWGHRTLDDGIECEVLRLPVGMPFSGVERSTFEWGNGGHVGDTIVVRSAEIIEPWTEDLVAEAYRREAEYEAREREKDARREAEKAVRVRLMEWRREAIVSDGRECAWVDYETLTALLDAAEVGVSPSADNRGPSRS